MLPGASSTRRRARSDLTRQQAVWSDPRAVKDYQDLLDGIIPEVTIDGPSAILGDPSSGLAKGLIALGLGSDVAIATPDLLAAQLPPTLGTLPDDEGGGPRERYPIYVTSPPTEYAGVVAACPEERRRDLVFLTAADGATEGTLRKAGRGGQGDTLVTLNHRAHPKTGKLRDCRIYLGNDKRGDPKYAGESCATGHWAAALQERFERGNLPLKVSTDREWRRTMYEKLVGEASINLVGALHDFATHKEVAQYYSLEVEDMMYELGKTLKGNLAVTLLYNNEERMLNYALDCQEIADTKTSMDAAMFPWRNGFFYRSSRLAIDQYDFPDTCPMHTEYLEYGRDKGLFEVPVPAKGWSEGYDI